MSYPFILRDDGYVVITMRRYPRFVRRELRNEYLSQMAPPRRLFEEWPRGLEQLEWLSRRRAVYLVCQCRVGQRCHRELLLLIAHERYGARVEGPYNAYPVVRTAIVQYDDGMKVDPFTERRLRKFVDDFRAKNGQLPTLSNLIENGFAHEVVKAALKAKIIEEFYVTLTNGTVVKGY